MSSMNSVGLLIGYSNTNEDLYSRTLAQAYRHGRRLWDPDHALRQEANIWEKSRRDPEILHAMERRLAKVANVRRRVVPAREEHKGDQRLALIFEDMIGQVNKFVESNRELAGAAFMGRTFAYINGHRRFDNFADSGFREWWTPESLTDVRKERFRFISDIEHGHVRRRLEMFSIAQHAWVDVRRPELFIKHVFNDEEGRLGWGRGLLEAIYYWHYSKSIVMREGLQAIARFGQGFLTIGIDGAREAGTDKPNTTVIQEWLDVLEDAQGRHALAHDKADEIKMQPFPGTGNSAAIEWCKYFDEGMSKLITGSVRVTGGGDGGSFARAETEADASEELMQHDRTILDESLTRDLLGLMFNLNRGVIVELGLADARCPKFDSVRQSREDPQEAATVIATVAPVMALVSDEAYKKIGYTAPKEGEATIGGVQSFGGGETLPGGFDIEEKLRRKGIKRPDAPSGNLPPQFGGDEKPAKETEK